MGIVAKSYRFDDEVRGELAKLRAVYGTDNAAMRFVFNLSGQAKVEIVTRVEGQIPKATLKKMPPDLSASSVITKMDDDAIEYTRPKFIPPKNTRHQRRT